MNLYVILGVIAAIIAIYRLRPPFLLWFAIWPAALYLIIKYGITPNVPASVATLYLSLGMLGLVAYLWSDEALFNQVTGQINTFIVDKKYTVPLYIVAIALPAALAFNIYSSMNVDVRAATFGRTIHPAPPGEITFKGKKIDLIKGENPFRELEETDPAKFKEHLAAGRTVYYQNCVYCHGDDMSGDGIFAHGFTPVPANFNSPTAIAMLQETYLFWRIAKGAPGLPAESGPWSSSMPAWENFLSEDEIWQVILYLYDYTGYKPREAEEHH